MKKAGSKLLPNRSETMRAGEQETDTLCYRVIALWWWLQEHCGDDCRWNGYWIYCDMTTATTLSSVIVRFQSAIITASTMTPPTCLWLPRAVWTSLSQVRCDLGDTTTCWTVSSKHHPVLATEHRPSHRRRRRRFIENTTRCPAVVRRSIYRMYRCDLRHLSSVDLVTAH